MTKNRSISFLCISALLAMGLGSAPAQSADLWQDLDPAAVAGLGAREFAPLEFRTVRVDAAALRSVLSGAPMEFTAGRTGGVEVSLPMPDGRLARFRAEESPIMEPGLAARYPEVHTYRGQGIDDPTATTRFGWTAAGFHAIILSSGGTAYIDPYRRGDTEHYISYFKRDHRLGSRQPLVCQVPGHDGAGIAPSTESIGRPDIDAILDHRGGTLRSYRLAQAADFEYVLFHSDPLPALPSKALAMSRGIIPTINRVNGVYERDLSIHLNLVANNEDIVFDTPADPYVNEDGTSMLVSNQATCDALIGSANYDIGHVFSTGGGGVAFLGVVCDDLLGGASQKAGGVTGNPSPISDSFDIDYVAHEMGHEFGGNHPFNGTAGSCSGSNRNAATAYEVGSGSTIMAYAGICGAQDLQPHSDDNFHVISLQEIITFTDAGNADACAVKTTVPNAAPEVDAGPNYTIPAHTPFTLTAVGSDPDNDAITYNWEEFDLGPANAGTVDNGSSPIFRPFPSTTNPSRTFPRWADILSNSTTYGELKPTTSRTMRFRCTVRDNYAGAGGVDWDEAQVTVSAGAGPFLLNEPNGGETWNTFTLRPIEWDVAGTDTAPISTSTVDILLSIDGGATFSHTLASGVANDGADSVYVPGVNTTTARVMVRGVDNIFFDASNFDFTIIGPTTGVGEPVALEDFALRVSPNPMRDAVQLDFNLGRSASVEMEVFSIQGRRVATIASGTFVAGRQSLRWDGRTREGSRAAAGVYQLRFAVDGRTVTRPMVVVR